MTEARRPAARNQSLTPEQILAHHEAAHAVIAIELGLGILEVGIDLATAQETGGIGSEGCRLVVADLTDVALQNLPKEHRRLAGQIDCNGTVLAAGPASDAKLLGEDPWVALQKQRSDLRKMRDLLRLARLAPNEEVQAGRLRVQVGLAVEALEDPEIWRAVEAVAHAVMERGPLSGADIEAIAAALLEPRAQK